MSLYVFQHDAINACVNGGIAPHLLIPCSDELHASQLRNPLILIAIELRRRSSALA